MGGPLVAVGLGLVATHAGHVLASPSPRAAFGSVVSLGAAVGVTGVGVRLAHGRADRARVVFRGVAVGAGVMSAALALAVAATPGSAVPAAALPRMAADLLTVGAVVGVLLGLYDARSRRDRRRAEALFANLSIPTAYVELTGGDRIVRAINGAFRDAFGPAGSHAGRPLRQCVPDSTDGRSLSDAVADGPRGRYRCAATAAHGAREFAVTPVDAGVPDHEYVTLADVTENRHRERRLSVLNRVLRHDLRSGLNVVLGHAELLAADPADPEAHLRTVRRRVDSLVGMSARARALDRQLSGSATARTVDLATLVADRLDARAGSPAVERSFPARPVVVRDDGLVGAVVDELLDNAAAHAGPDPSVRVAVAVVDGGARLTVADDGPGIPPSERAVLEGTRETDLDHASGLGLWFVRWVVTELGGDVTVATGDDGPNGPAGTVVTVRLPLATDAGADVPARPPQRA